MLLRGSSPRRVQAIVPQSASRRQARSGFEPVLEVRAGGYDRRVGCVLPRARLAMQLERFVLIAALLLIGPLGIARGAEPAHAKKLIEWGWDEPDPKFMRTHIEQMERLPFDGLIFHVPGNHNENLTWDIWGDRRF